MMFSLPYPLQQRYQPPTGGGGGGTGAVSSVFGRTGDVIMYQSDILNSGGVVTTRQVIAGAGLTGGGSLVNDVTLSANVRSVFGRGGDIQPNTGDYNVFQVTNAVPDSRRVIAGSGLGGGGTLAADITLTANVRSVNGQTGDVIVDISTAGGVPSTRQVIAGSGLSGGGSLITDITLTANVTSVFGRVGDVTLQPTDIVAGGGVPATRQVIAGAGLSGGGALSSDVTLSLIPLSPTDIVNAGGVPASRRIIASTGLVGGGTLDNDITLAVVQNSTHQLTDYSVNGGAIVTGNALNFIAGQNVSLGISYNAGAQRTDVVIAALSGGSGGGGSQTPWLQDIDGNKFSLSNAGAIDTTWWGDPGIGLNAAALTIYSVQQADGGPMGWPDPWFSWMPRIAFNFVGQDVTAQLAMVDYGTLAIMYGDPTVATANWKNDLGTLYCRTFKVTHDVDMTGATLTADLLNANTYAHFSGGAQFQPGAYADATYAQAPVRIEGTASGPMNTAHSPRVGFDWYNGVSVIAAQIGMDSNGLLRTYDSSGTSFVPFYASQFVASSGYKFPDNSIQTTSMNSRSVLAGSGLQGGGPLSSDVTLSIAPSSTVQLVNFQVNTVAPISTKNTLNLIAGTGVTLSIVDNTGAGRADVTISSTASGGSDTPWTVDHNANSKRLYSLDQLLVDTLSTGAADNPSPGIVLGGTRPTILFDQGVSSRSRIGQETPVPRVDLMANAYYDGANWQRDDTSQPSTMSYLISTVTSSGLILRYAPAGTGAIPWTTPFIFDVINNVETISGIRPTILFDQGVSARTRFFQNGANPNFALAINTYNDGTNWQRDDTSQASAFFSLFSNASGATSRFWYAGAGTGNVPFTSIFSFDLANSLQTINGTRPTILFDTGVGARSRIFQAVSGARLDSSVNSYYDGSAWQRDDVSQAAVLSILTLSSFQLRSTNPGANPIAWNTNFLFDIASSTETISGTRPTILFDQGATVGRGRLIGPVAQHTIHLTANLWYDGANWQRDDTGNTSVAIALYGNNTAYPNTVRYAFSSSGSGNVSLSYPMSFDLANGYLGVYPNLTISPNNQAPAYSVDIQGWMSSAMYMRIYNSHGAGYSGIKFKGDTKEYEWVCGGSSAANCPGGFGIIDRTASAWRVVLTTAGNFGLGGLTTPNYALDVAGDANVSSVYRVAGNPAGTPSVRNDRTASRAVNSIYQNTAGKPIWIQIVLTAANNNTIIFYVDSSSNPLLAADTVVQSTGSTQTVTVKAWVPVNWYYKLINAASISTWIEWT